MKLLVIGSGGREHAMAWRLAQSPRVSRVYVAPGNAGTAREDGLFNVELTDIAKQFMMRHKIPTAKHKTFTSTKDARTFLDAHPAPIVIKADGLAAGKGV